MYKKGVRSMPRTIRKEIARVCDTSMTIMKTEVARTHWRNGIGTGTSYEPFPFPLNEVDPALSEEFRKVLSEIKALPSYWLLTPSISLPSPYIVFECKLKADVEEEVYDALEGEFEAGSIISLLFPSGSSHYGIY